MILITGGLGFIGSHTTRALLDDGESCVLVQRRAATFPSAWANEMRERAVIEQADITDRERFLEIGRRHRITGIVHLAGSMPWPPGSSDPVDSARGAVDSLLNVIQAAREWDVTRVTVASTIGVYGGVDAPNPLREDLPLSITAGHVIPAFKKIGELLTDHLTNATGISIVNARLAAIWGPLGRPTSVFFPAPQLIHAAARGNPLDLSTVTAPIYTANGIDLCYVKDCAVAIARLQLATKLHHRTYNVGSGRVTTVGDLVAAINVVAPGYPVDVVEGRDPHGPDQDSYLDITRVQQDTGYRPAYDTERAVAEYVDWLRVGNVR
jgi:UDP-glucose 4-epimerase